MGHDRLALAGSATGNVHNGYSVKTISGDFGNIERAVPRDRTASFTPQLIPKHQRRIRRL